MIRYLKPLFLALFLIVVSMLLSSCSSITSKEHEDLYLTFDAIYDDAYKNPQYYAKYKMYGEMTVEEALDIIKIFAEGEPREQDISPGELQEAYELVKVYIEYVRSEAYRLRDMLL